MAPSSGYSRGTLMGTVAVLTFGLTALTSVLGGGVLIPTIFITGFFVLIPLIGILGDDFPLVESPTETPRKDPVETLRDRYARGEIDQAEFERRLEYLVETEDTEFDVEQRLGSPRVDSSTKQSRERELELE